MSKRYFSHIVRMLVRGEAMNKLLDPEPHRLPNRNRCNWLRCAERQNRDILIVDVVHCIYTT